MSEWVVMSHPNLKGQPIRVSESAVPIHELSGWAVSNEVDLHKITREEFVEKFGYDPES